MTLSYNYFQVPLMSDDTMSLAHLRRLWEPATCLCTGYRCMLGNIGTRFIGDGSEMLKVKGDMILPPRCGAWKTDQIYFIPQTDDKIIAE